MADASPGADYAAYRDWCLRRGIDSEMPQVSYEEWREETVLRRDHGALVLRRDALRLIQAQKEPRNR